MHNGTGSLPDWAAASRDLDDLGEAYGRSYLIAASREGTFWAARHRDDVSAAPIVAFSSGEMRLGLRADSERRALRSVAPPHVPASHRKERR
jgi:hypothetical protein